MGNLGDWIGVFLIIAVLFGNGGLFGGNRESVSDAVNQAIANQNTQTGLRDILLSSGNNNYETAMLISNQIGTCCCDLKSTLLQNRYEDVVRENTRLLADKSNADQSAYLLSVMGKWVANPTAA